jgi:hypothetical protein
LHAVGVNIVFASTSSGVGLVKNRQTTIAKRHPRTDNKILNGLLRKLASIMALNKNGHLDTYFYVSLRMDFYSFELGIIARKEIYIYMH